MPAHAHRAAGEADRRAERHDRDGLEGREERPDEQQPRDREVREVRQTDRQQANLLGLTGGVIGALAVGLLDHYFFNGEFSHMATLLWLFMGLAVVQIRIGEVVPTRELAPGKPG